MVYHFLIHRASDDRKFVLELMYFYLRAKEMMVIYQKLFTTDNEGHHQLIIIRAVIELISVDLNCPAYLLWTIDILGACGQHPLGK